MSAGHFLAFDLGAESGRAILGTLDGGRLSLAEKHRFANPERKDARPISVEPARSMGRVEDRPAQNVADVGGELDGIGVDTWGVDFGLLAAGGEILGNPIMYRDPCTDGVPSAYLAQVPRKDIRRHGHSVHADQFAVSTCGDEESDRRTFWMRRRRCCSCRICSTISSAGAQERVVDRIDEPDVRSRENAVGDGNSGGRCGFPTRILPEIVPSRDGSGKSARGGGGRVRRGHAPVIAPAS